tara:strand:+ start:262 stop:471 length:210 start_codon:yes stop_codon:yes gene_type:complete
MAAMKRVFVQKTAKWGVTAEGELWRKGKNGYMAGYASRPLDRDSFEASIEAAEEESRALMAQARAEFGL